MNYCGVVLSFEVENNALKGGKETASASDIALKKVRKDYRISHKCL